ncbi:MAG: hypothetical protein KY444_11640, partial [Gemmatimonadetes bacterium]|nr:hypothetical protein [Gemmatimonadota bacterium]
MGRLACHPANCYRLRLSMIRTNELSISPMLVRRMDGTGTNPGRQPNQAGAEAMRVMVIVKASADS